MSETIEIPTPDGSFAAYVARPAQARAPVIVVLQEIFGINADLRETCEVLAGQGYLAVCPDLFWRMQPGVSLTDQTEAEWKQALALYHAFDVPVGVRDVEATINFARSMSGGNGRVGVMGFCLGGLMSYLAAVRTDVDAAVAYYGGGIDQFVDEGLGLHRPLMMHLGEDDAFIDSKARRRILFALDDLPLVEIHNYPGCQHAFARNGGVNFDAEAAERAHARTLRFFGEALQ